MKLFNVVTIGTLPTYVDYEDENGNTIPGNWRTENIEGGLQRIERVGANNSTRIAAQLRDTLCNYFVEAGEEVTPWQYERALRDAIINLP